MQICPLCEKNPVEVDKSCADCWLVLQRLDAGRPSVEGKQLRKRLRELKIQV